MDVKYIIDGSTLTDIADSIRNLHGTSEPIPVEDFAGLIVGVEPSVEEYMRISDYLKYPKRIDEANYTKDEINECKRLVSFYMEMEENNG